MSWPAIWLAIQSTVRVPYSGCVKVAGAVRLSTRTIATFSRAVSCTQRGRSASTAHRAEFCHLARRVRGYRVVRAKRQRSQRELGLGKMNEHRAEAPLVVRKFIRTEPPSFKRGANAFWGYARLESVNRFRDPL